MRLEPIVLEQYELSETIGRGAFSKVKLAHSPVLKANVAIKIISKVKIGAKLRGRDNHHGTAPAGKRAAAAAAAAAITAVPSSGRTSERPENLVAGRKLVGMDEGSVDKENQMCFQNNNNNTYGIRQRNVRKVKTSIIGEGSSNFPPLASNEEKNPSACLSSRQIQLIENAPGQFSTNLSKEIRILQSLSHPNIIGLYQVIETPYEYYIVTQYASGGEIKTFLHERGRLSETEGRYFFRQMASAIYYCHQMGVVHRDIKLENILLNRPIEKANELSEQIERFEIESGLSSSLIGNEQQILGGDYDEHDPQILAARGLPLILISDFGLSRTFKEGGSLSTTFCGTPLYAAPELISGSKYYGPKVDVWALGVVLYTLLCGQMPFSASSMAELYAKIKKVDVEMPMDLSADVKAVFMDVFVASPEQRISMVRLCKAPWVKGQYGCTPNERFEKDGVSSLDDLNGQAARIKNCKAIQFDRNALTYYFWRGETNYGREMMVARLANRFGGGIYDKSRVLQWANSSSSLSGATGTLVEYAALPLAMTELFLIRDNLVVEHMRSRFKVLMLVHSEARICNRAVYFQTVTLNNLNVVIEFGPATQSRIDAKDSQTEEASVNTFTLRKPKKAMHLDAGDGGSSSLRAFEGRKALCNTMAPTWLLFQQESLDRLAALISQSCCH